ncbi:MAG: DNA-directed RNA polymerase subunit P [Candidatus Diapherotrites archaeon]|uniref:DNA-directed RNA polymerase subunit Rpo12 n=1 Tax=Candidatus Iainarchaeum sp. TaxID=3101447 RepID=A0A8T3YKV3_9ARCH|nr:DNA-directed RNA polymerase subunit P [Candidatus Diapherotrites archaeon]
MYRCLQCQKEVNSIIIGAVRCPSCGYKIFTKVRDPLTKTVKAV